MTLPVSCIAPIGVHADNRFDRPRSRPSTLAVVVNRLAPARDTTPSSPTSTWVLDLQLRFTLRVPFRMVGHWSLNLDPTGLNRHFAVIGRVSARKRQARTPLM
jgi:hypothetical protein